MGEDFGSQGPQARGQPKQLVGQLCRQVPDRHRRKTTRQVGSPLSYPPWCRVDFASFAERESGSARRGEAHMDMIRCHECGVRSERFGVIGGLGRQKLSKRSSRGHYSCPKWPFCPFGMSKLTEKWPLLEDGDRLRGAVAFRESGR